jgi:hypothetical protein
MKLLDRVRKLLYGYIPKSEVWDLDMTISKFVLPRLKMFKSYVASYPTNMTSDEWQEKLDDMIFAFQWHIDYADGNLDTSSKNWEQINTDGWKRYDKGIETFAKLYRNLWC